MKMVIKLAVLLSVMALNASSVQAQTTYVVLKAYFALSGLQQTSSGAVSVRITNKDLLAAMNATGSFHFSSGAQIILQSFEDQLPVILVRDTNGSTTDVSSDLTLSDSGSEIHTANNLTSWAIWNYALSTGKSLDFNISGLASLYRGPINSPNGTLTRVYNAGTHLYGQGDIGGSPAVFSGAVYAGFPTVEVR
jgi:hypothetical protein